MNPPSTNLYKNHRFPTEIISHGVWLYFRFCLSYRDVEELLFVRGVIVSYEAIRQWCRKFGQVVSKSTEMVDLTMALFAKYWVNGNQDELLSLLG